MPISYLKRFVRLARPSTPTSASLSSASKTWHPKPSEPETPLKSRMRPAGLLRAAQPKSEP